MDSTDNVRVMGAKETAIAFGEFSHTLNQLGSSSKRLLCYSYPYIRNPAQSIALPSTKISSCTGDNSGSALIKSAVFAIAFL
jgi:hypothetical protein